jgi:hypothetical protein
VWSGDKRTLMLNYMLLSHYVQDNPPVTSVWEN